MNEHEICMEISGEIFMQSKHIMVVDDDRDIRDALVEALSFEGYDVYCAENGKVALDQLKGLRSEELPGCIILDLMMPVMSGPQFLEEFDHENEEISGIPIVVASANLDYRVDEKHVVSKLKKPMDIEQIYEAAHRFCGHPLQ